MNLPYSLDECDEDTGTASAESDIPKPEIKDRQKDVVSDVGNFMMTHVIGTRKAETGRQPLFHMDSPVDFFGCDQISTPANEDARSDPKAQQKINEDDNYSIAGEQDCNMRRGLA